MKSSDKTWCTGEENGHTLQYSWLENPVNSMKRQKNMMLEDECPRPEGVQYATGEEWRAIMNSSSKNKAGGSKQKRCSVVDVSDGESKV